MSSRQQERAAEPVEPLGERSGPVRGWPVLPPSRTERELTVAEAIALARQSGEDAA